MTYTQDNANSRSLVGQKRLARDDSLKQYIEAISRCPAERFEADGIDGRNTRKLCEAAASSAHSKG
jgi:hypothetical protein